MKPEFQVLALCLRQSDECVDGCLKMRPEFQVLALCLKQSDEFVDGCLKMRQAIYTSALCLKQTDELVAVAEETAAGGPSVVGHAAAWARHGSFRARGPSL